MNKSRRKRYLEFVARVKWAQEQLCRESVVVFAVPESSTDTKAAIRAGIVGESTEVLGCMAAILDTAKRGVEDFAKAVGQDPEKLWNALLNSGEYFPEEDESSEGASS